MPELEDPQVPMKVVPEGGVAASPSISSLSSIASNTSTDRLIHSLSTTKLHQATESPTKITPINATPINATPIQSTTTTIDEKIPAPIIPQTVTVEPPTTPTTEFVTSPTSSTPKVKKGLKFTVRKVSRELPDTTYKPLPELKDVTREQEKLELVQAKYEQYETRIVKIEKEIEFLSNLLPPYNVEIDYATRTKISRAIEKLRMKQDELDRKKYGLGITISRLWREHDDSDIWVRSFSN